MNLLLKLKTKLNIISKSHYTFLLYTLLVPIICVNNITNNWRLSDFIFLILNFIMFPIFIYPFTSFFFHRLKKSNNSIYLYLGFGVASISIFARILGHLSLLYGAVFWLIWVIFLVYDLKQKDYFARVLYKDLKSIYKENTHFNYVYYPLYPLFILLLIQAVLYKGGLNPGSSTDLALLHYSLPKLYIENHKIVEAWWLRATFIPQFVHMFYVAIAQWINALGLRADIVVLLVNVQLFFVALTATIYFCRNIITALFFGLLVLVIPVSRFNLGIPYLDATNAVFIFFVFLSCLSYLRDNKNIFLYSASFFSVIAFCTKPFAAMYLLPLLFCFAVYYLIINKVEKSKQISFFRNVSLSILASLPILILYQLQTFLMSGNFLFPFINPNSNNRFFWDNAAIKGFQGAIAHYKTPLSLESIPQLFTKIATTPLVFSDSGYHILGAPWLILMGTISVLALYFLIKRIENKGVITLGVFIILFQIYAWYFSSAIYRYTQPQVFLLAFLIALSLNYLKSHKFNILLIIILTFIFAEFRGPYKTHQLPRLQRKKAQILKFLNKSVLNYQSNSYLLKKQGEEIILFNLFVDNDWHYLTVPFMGDWFGQANWNSVHAPPDNKIEHFKQYYNGRGISHVRFGKLNGVVKSNKFNMKSMHGDYFKCFKEVYSDIMTSIFEINKKDIDCFDKKIPLIKGIETLKKYHSKSHLPFWPIEKGIEK